MNQMQKTRKIDEPNESNETNESCHENKISGKKDMNGIN